MVPEALQHFVRAAADFATNGKLGKLEFAKDAHGRPDISAFDFTSMMRAESSARVQEKHGARVLLGLVGDCLVEVRRSGLPDWGRRRDFQRHRGSMVGRGRLPPGKEGVKKGLLFVVRSERAAWCDVWSPQL